MSTDDLTQNEILVLLVLMSENRAVRNADMKHFGPVVTAGERTRLKNLKLITAEKPTRFIELALTDEGWDYCTALFTSDVPSGMNPATRVAFTMMRGFERFMARQEVVPAQVFQLVEAVTAASSPSVTQQIKDAYSRLANHPGGWVGLAELRHELRGITRRDLDAALVELQQRPGVSLIPEGNQKTLTKADRDAAVIVGTQHTHLLKIETQR